MINITLKDFLKLCEAQDTIFIHNLNVDKEKITKEIFESYLNDEIEMSSILIAMQLYNNLSSLEFVKKCSEYFNKMSLETLLEVFKEYLEERRFETMEFMLDAISRPIASFSDNEIKRALDNYDDSYLEAMYQVRVLQSELHSSDFDISDYENLPEKDLEDIVKEYITHSDETTFRNSLEILKLVVPTSSSMVHNSRARRLSYLEKFRDKIVYDNYLELFDEAFPELVEDYDHLISYKISVQNEADYISEMNRKYPNYRHD